MLRTARLFGTAQIKCSPRIHKRLQRLQTTEFNLRSVEKMPLSRKRKRGGNRGEFPNKRGVRGNYELPARENKDFEKYYKESGLIPEGDWEVFMDTLRKPLPSTFRVTGCRREARELLRIIKDDYLNDLMDIEIAGQPIEAPKAISWYPSELAWQINLHRKLIRTCGPLKDLHTFLIQETESGNISRQEAVSMIPPLVLDIHPHHRVLDMCAAPGSKTAQMIEMIHADVDTPVPSGVVVANDSDNKRCYLMVHQVKRLESPCFMVVNQDASRMPNFFTSPPEEKEKKILRFDRILADVPCSGDGTLRKNPDVWHKWNPVSSFHLHNLQSRILRRGLEMLEVGGRLVYSTCSMNPLEDEAVVADMLTKTGESVAVVDVSGSLPGLKSLPGVSSWKVMARDGAWYSSVEEVPDKLTSQLKASHFPPKDAHKMNLHRCFRILPHLQDTGGFFVCVLEKTSELPWMLQSKVGLSEVPESSVKDVKCDEVKGEVKDEEVKDGIKDEDEEQDNVSGVKEEERDRSDGKTVAGRAIPSKKSKRFGYKEDPFIFLDKDDPLWPSVREFYGVTDFPVDQLMVRCHDGKRRNVYFASCLVRDLLNYNMERFKVINLGLKLIARSESKYTTCGFRPVQDGMATLYPYMSRRIIRVVRDDIVTLLSSDNPFVSKMTKNTQTQLEDLDQGGCVFIYEPHDSQEGPRCRLLISGWKGLVSCRSFLPRNDRGHFLRLCGSSLKTKDEILAEKAAKKLAAEERCEENGSENGGSGTEDEDSEEVLAGDCVDSGATSVDKSDSVDMTGDFGEGTDGVI